MSSRAAPTSERHGANEGAVSRFRFRFRTSVLVMVLVVQMVPLEALVIPLFIQAKNLGLLHHLLGLVVVYVAFSLPFAICTLRGFVSAVRRELEEAAYVDGASYAVAAGLRQFFTEYGTNWGGAMAGSTSITVPVMLSFVVVQRQLSEGLVAGAVKG